LRSGSRCRLLTARKAACGGSSRLTHQGLAPLLGLHQATVTSAEIRKDGRLTLAFADGGVLLVLPDERYEAFTVAGSLPPIRRGFNFVAIPGGGLARF